MRSMPGDEAGIVRHQRDRLVAQLVIAGMLVAAAALAVLAFSRTITAF